MNLTNSENLTRSKIVERVNLVMHQGFEIPMEKLTPQATIGGDLGLDSLDAIDMLVQLEEQMGVKVSGERLMSVKKLEDIYSLIEEISLADEPRVVQ